MPKVHTTDNPDSFAIYCPACKWPHVLTGWQFNHDLERPTFKPSLKCTGTREPVDICHSQITDGMIMFYPDSTHWLRGQTVPLPEFQF